eukprot:scaffold3351_cov242-Pinguiococcus_pyrenoidosus.AAC.6
MNLLVSAAARLSRTRAFSCWPCCLRPLPFFLANRADGAGRRGSGRTKASQGARSASSSSGSRNLMLPPDLKARTTPLTPAELKSAA